jgi:hypothetical protein
VADKKEKILIAVFGAKRCGKNTFCQFLTEQLKGAVTVKTVSTVDIINEVVALITGKSPEDFERLKDEHIRWRGYQQAVGDMLRENSVLKIIEEIGFKIQTHQIKERLLIINGTRYQAELDWIRNRGGAAIRIFNRAAEEVASKDTHKTEQNISGMSFDWSLKNEGTLADLEREAKWIAGYIKEKYKI